MARYLVIVESPAKVKTIKKFLGSNYVVTASNGHVRDLPKSQLGIDVEHDFEPKYITIRGKGDILANLRKEVKKADKVFLATDPDREGEAIAWHLSKALKLDDKKMFRISFNEITKSAVKASIKEAREIDMDLVDAQQARRALDRIVGYRISPLLWAKVKRGLSAGRVQSVALRIIADREEEIDAFIPEEYWTVGYRISPLLWAKVKRGLSAGRVQSVALRIIADREEEIDAFIPEEYWTLDAELAVKGERKHLQAKFYGKEKEKITIRSKEELDRIVKEVEGETFRVVDVKKGERSQKPPVPFTTRKEKEKITIRSKEELDRIVKEVEGETFRVVDVKKGERSQKPPVPFTTSTLQQEASKVLNFATQKTMRIAQQLYEGIDLKGNGTVGKVLNFATQKTMRIAQQLYEGIDLKGNGTVGLITYLRTDSTRVSEEADENTRKYVSEVYGEAFVTEGQKKKEDGKKIQDAHEAIRPTDVTRTPALVKESLSRDQFRLYQLIWKRFVASRMAPAKFETTSVKIAAGEYRFQVSASRVAFEGFREVYVESGEEKAENNVLLKSLDVSSELTKKQLDAKQHFTQPPAHYTEAVWLRRNLRQHLLKLLQENTVFKYLHLEWHLKVSGKFM